MSKYAKRFRALSEEFCFTLCVLRQACGRIDAALFFGAALCGLAASALTSVAPVAFKYLLDTLGQNSAVPQNAFESPASWLIVYTAASLLMRLAGDTRGYLFGMAEQSVSRQINLRAFSHTLALPMRAHLGQSTGALIQTVENGLQGYRLVLQQGLLTLAPAIVEITIIAGLFFHFFDPVFGFVFAACAAAYAIIFTDGAVRILRASRRLSRARVDTSAGLSEALLNIETVKAFGGEGPMARRFGARLSDVKARFQDLYRIRLLSGVLVGLVFTAGLGATLWLAVSRIQAGSMTIGDLVLANAWLFQVLRPIELLGVGVRDFGQGLAYIEGLNGLFRIAPENAPYRPSEERPMPDTPPSIKFENVSFSYEPGQRILDGVSFEVPAGTTTALVGPSGSGKSSIIRLLMRFYEPDEGRILINDVDIREYELSELRRMIAYIPQEVSLFNESPAFNIAFPDEIEDPAAIRRAAEQARIDHVLSEQHPPSRSVAGERGLKLSGGEKQRIAIARATYRRATILLADEPTSALDHRTAEMIQEQRIQAGRGATAIVIAHRLLSSVHANQIVVVANGKVVEQGDHLALIAMNGVYASM